MHALVSQSRRSGAFTLIELMIVVVIVAILALVAIPLYQGNVIAAKMSEGIAGCGTIRTAFRTYAASHAGNYPVLTAQNGSQLSVLGDRGDGSGRQVLRRDELCGDFGRHHVHDHRDAAELHADPDVHHQSGGS